MKKIVLKYIDKAVYFIYKRIKVVEKEHIELRKQKLLALLVNKGYGLRLNGTYWTFSKPKKIIIGNNAHIGNNAFFKSEGGLIIGDNTHISRNVTIYTVNHDYEGKQLPYDRDYNYKPVVIEENVWIGMNVTIAPGVRIGKGAIIGIGTLVNRDIDALEIVGSPKTIHIKNRNKDHYTALDTDRSYGGINGIKITKSQLDSYSFSYKDQCEKKIIFIVGTGRSGTKSFVDILSQNSKCKAYHESIPQLIRLSTMISYTNDPKYYKELDDIFSYKKFEANKTETLVLSDQRLWNLIPYLSSCFKNSKFIHVVREPVNCILSMVSRNWYKPDEFPEIVTHDWAKYRLNGCKIGFYSKDEWNSMTPIQKCSWYYGYVNKTINENLQQLESTRYLSIKLENLKSDLPTIAEFIGHGDYNFQHIVGNKSKPEYSLNRKKIDINNAKEEIESVLKNFRS